MALMDLSEVGGFRENLETGSVAESLKYTRNLTHSENIMAVSSYLP